MKRFLLLLLQALPFAALACLVDCTGSASSPASARPPPPPAGPAALGAPLRTFAVSALFLGDTKQDGSPSSAAWRTLGYDLDGKLTLSGATDVCGRAAGAPRSVDGDRGIDNAFGAAVVPVLNLAVLDKPISNQLRRTLRAGTYTELLELTGLADDAGQTNTSLSGRILLGATLGRAPTFTPADDWPSATGPLPDGHLAQDAKASFPAAYVTAGTWVGYAAGDLLLHLDFGTSSHGGRQPVFDVVVHRAVVTFDHASPHRLTNGIIAGVVLPSELIATLGAVRGQVSTALCTDSAIATIDQQLAQAVDILSDGTNAAGIACDAISIGVGFEADEIANVTRDAAEPPVSPDPCIADAGASDAAAPDAAAPDAGP
jgi:hypothetical protein